MSAPTTREWLRTAVDRVAVGSRPLAARTLGRVLRAVRDRVGGWPWWVQLPLAYVALLRGPGVLAGLGDRIHERVESGAWTGMLTVSAALWIVAAYRAGRGEDEAADSEEQEAEGVTEQAENLTEAPADHPLTPGDLVCAVQAIGTPHAQLVPLAKHLGVTTDAVRAAAARAGWDVKDVRMQGRSSTAGLRADEAPSLPSPDLSRSVVGAGQPADDNDDDAGGQGREKRFRVVPIGLSGRVVHDPDETIRHHKVAGQ